MVPDPEDGSGPPSPAFPLPERRAPAEASGFFRGLFSFLITAFLIIGGSAAVVWPLWTLATRNRGGFAALATILVLAFAGLALFRRAAAGRKGRKEKRSA